MLSKEWSDYNPKEGYEKEFQDVILNDGRKLFYCWPNAGFWNVCNERINPETYDQDIPVSETKQVRISHYNWESKKLNNE